ncbi:acyl-ACP desaturase [Sabulibacter ruber]|uniref:acyl-ACP desaturase n=1 Tax=Sabulibacter ruber TaxID=2811901 RepID=UPI001A97B5EE|nr:acyl-ACP desaturase [Sabulibacter ruber]
MIEKAIHTRTEVMKYLENFLDKALPEFLKSVEDSWQPADFLPDARLDSFFDELRDLRERARELSYDLLAVLIGDTITEEALPTYESWIMSIKDVNRDPDSSWMKWNRGWTSEENRHGDLLNRYLYLTGRIDMRQMEASTQYLIADGMDIQTDDDPYRSFVYTSFQETATNVSHRRVGALAKKAGETTLSRICNYIAADEGRHAKAYKTFVKKIFEVDPSEMMIAFEDMMRKKIVMPAHYLRELGIDQGQTFGHFTDAAQRIGVYTSSDYVEIMETLIREWKISSITGLNEAGERARDYLMALPNRLRRVAERLRVPELQYKFKWIDS